jgi:hypothetical protein
LRIEPCQHFLRRLERGKRAVGDDDDGAGHGTLSNIVIAGLVPAISTQLAKPCRS